MIREAEISPCGLYRYSLTRVWNYGLLRCVWICCNPSTADAEVDDPTVRKITGFSSRWGYGGFTLLNVFSLRSTDPKQLLKNHNPIGPGNGPNEIRQRWQALTPHHQPVIAWGNLHPKLAPSAFEVARAVQIFWHLGLTKAGQPRHPLYVPYTRERLMGDPSQLVQEMP